MSARASPGPALYGLSVADFGADSRRTASGGPNAIGDNGGSPGYGAALLLYPDSGRSVAVTRSDDWIIGYGLAPSVAARLGIDEGPEEHSGGQVALLVLAYVPALGCYPSPGHRQGAARAQRRQPR